MWWSFQQKVDVGVGEGAVAPPWAGRGQRGHVSVPHLLKSWLLCYWCCLSTCFCGKLKLLSTQNVFHCQETDVSFILTRNHKLPASDDCLFHSWDVVMETKPSYCLSAFSFFLFIKFFSSLNSVSLQTSINIKHLITAQLAVSFLLQPLSVKQRVSFKVKLFLSFIKFAVYGNW